MSQLKVLAGVAFTLFLVGFLLTIVLLLAHDQLRKLHIDLNVAGYSTLAIEILAAAFGIRAWRIRLGKIATIGSLILVLLFVCQLLTNVLPTPVIAP
jgi:hypothetical protein